MKRLQRFITPAAWIFYLVIVFEFLFMITPFALYFYSAYKPAIGLLNGSAYTAWLTGFFLPHFAQTNSELLSVLNSAGWALAYLGLLLFLVSAIQLYGSKLLRLGAVTGLLYRYIRHPQYLALAVLGLGTTLIWPRFIVLIAFISMLFIYRWLARFEEENCEQKYGASYREYLEKTGRFLPRFAAAKTGSGKGRQTPRPALAGFAVYICALALAISIGLVLREHTLGSVAAIYQDRVAIVSPALMPDESLMDIYTTAAAGADIESRNDAGGAPMLIYIVPLDWYLPDLPIDPHEEVRQRGGHARPSQIDHDHYRVLITRIRSHSPHPRGRDILRKAHGFDPLLVVEVDMKSGSVIGQFKPPASVIWGDISSPLL